MMLVEIDFCKGLIRKLDKNWVWWSEFQIIFFWIKIAGILGSQILVYFRGSFLQQLTEMVLFMNYLLKRLHTLRLNQDPPQHLTKENPSSTEQKMNFQNVLLFLASMFIIVLGAPGVSIHLL